MKYPEKDLAGDVVGKVANQVEGTVEVFFQFHFQKILLNDPVVQVEAIAASGEAPIPIDFHWKQPDIPIQKQAG